MLRPAEPGVAAEYKRMPPADAVEEEPHVGQLAHEELSSVRVQHELVHHLLLLDEPS